MRRTYPYKTFHSGNFHHKPPFLASISGEEEGGIIFIIFPHFNLPGHNIDHMTFSVLEKINNNNPQYRKARESHFIEKLKY